MYCLRSVDVLSCAKMMAAIHGCLGLILLPFFLLGGFVSLIAGRGGEAASGVILIVFAILVPFFYAAMGFLFGALGGWIYNLVSRKIGGVRFDLAVPGTIPMAGVV